MATDLKVEGVYTYLCRDGITRTRCAAHLKAERGQSYGIAPWYEKTGGLRPVAGVCSICRWERAASVVRRGGIRVEVE